MVAEQRKRLPFTFVAFLRLTLAELAARFDRSERTCYNQTIVKRGRRWLLCYRCKWAAYRGVLNLQDEPPVFRSRPGRPGSRVRFLDPRFYLLDFFVPDQPNVIPYEHGEAPTAIFNPFDT